MGSHDEEPECDVGSDDRLSSTHPPGVFPALIQCQGLESPLVPEWSSTIASFDRTNIGYTMPTRRHTLRVRSRVVVGV
ncbi:hypothetical protein GBAR_LOCUS23367, partial [Geodia barretti]